MTDPGDNPNILDLDEIAAMPGDAMEAAEVICKRWRAAKKMLQLDTNPLPFYLDYLQWWALGTEFIDAHADEFKPQVAAPGLTHDQQHNIKAIVGFMDTIATLSSNALSKRRSKDTGDGFRLEIRMAMGRRAAYTFTDDDFDRLQVIIKELRDFITSSKDISDDHKRRLLMRLELLQAEVHKTSSTVDRMFGFILEAGNIFRQVAEQVGEAAKKAQPAMALLREMAEITVRVMAAAQGFPAQWIPPLLPSGQKALPTDDNIVVETKLEQTEQAQTGGADG